MPTLEKRITDGGYYIRHFYKEHNTWQIVGDGVRILAARGVTEGSRFSTGLFMELWTRGLVYHGDTIPAGAHQPCGDSGARADLERRIGDFYGLVHARNDKEAWKIVAPSVIADEDANESPEDAFARFAQELRGMNLDRWWPLDIQAYDAEVEIVQENQPSFRGTKFGVGLVRLSLRSSSNVVEQELKQYWIYSEGQWWLMWPVFTPLPISPPVVRAP